MSEITKVSLGNYLNFPNTKKFLEDNLKDKSREFVSNLLALSDGDQNLKDCDPNRLMMCAMNATALNLPLNKNLGYAYVVAYNGNPQFQIGYKGLIQLAIRSGAYKFINSTEVREGEISRNKFTGEITFLSENPSGKIIGYMAYIEMLNGFKASLYMTEQEIEEHAKRYSKSYQYDLAQKKRTSKWSDPLERKKMAKKTVLKGVLGTYGVLSTEIVQALQHDSEYDDAPAPTQQTPPNSDKNKNIPDAEIVPQSETKKIQI